MLSDTGQHIWQTIETSSLLATTVALVSQTLWPVLGVQS